MVITEKSSNKVLYIGSDMPEEHESFFIVGNPKVAFLKTLILTYDVPYEKSKSIDYTAKDWCYTELEGFYLKPKEESEQEKTEQAYREKLVKEVSEHGYNA